MTSPLPPFVTLNRWQSYLILLWTSEKIFVNLLFMVKTDLYVFSCYASGSELAPLLHIGEKSCLLSPCVHGSHKPSHRRLPVTACYCSINISLSFCKLGFSFKRESLLIYLNYCCILFSASMFASRKETYVCLLSLLFFFFFAIIKSHSYTWIFWPPLDYRPWIIFLGPCTMPDARKVLTSVCWLASSPLEFWSRAPNPSWAVHSIIITFLTPCAP